MGSLPRRLRSSKRLFIFLMGLVGSGFCFHFFLSRVEKKLQVSDVLCREVCIFLEGLPPPKHLLDSYICFLKVTVSLLTVKSQTKSLIFSVPIWKGWILPKVEGSSSAVRLFPTAINVGAGGPRCSQAVSVECTKKQKWCNKIKGTLPDLLFLYSESLPCPKGWYCFRRHHLESVACWRD